MGCNLFHSLYVIVTEGAKANVILLSVGALCVAAFAAYFIFRGLRRRPQHGA